MLQYTFDVEECEHHCIASSNYNKTKHSRII